VSFASPIVRVYLIAAASVLIFAGIAIAVFRFVFRKNTDHAWHAYRGWLVMIPLILGAILLGRVATIIFLGVVALIGFTEFARATGLYRDWLMTGVVYIGIAGITWTCLVSTPGENTLGWYGLFIAIPVYVIAGILLVPIVRDRTQGQLQVIALAMVGFMYVGWMFGHLAFGANAHNPDGYLLFLLFSVPLTDVAAFTFGRMFGRHKLRPNISPNKTLEGSIGALAVGMAMPWLLRFSLPQFTPTMLVLSGLIIGIGSQLGDLSISVIKRDIGIKDMGALIEGHGGVLDRIDSLIYVAPIFFHMKRYFIGT
jgi:phosphatidate cytidylyltransferase